MNFIIKVPILLSLLMFYLPVFETNNDRQKRLLHFPEKTNVVMTMSLLKLFPSESIINTLTEYDVLFPVPLHPYGIHKRNKRQLERDMIQKQFKAIADVFGFSEEGCLKILICGVKHMLARKESNDKDNLLLDVLDIVFDLKVDDHPENCEVASLFFVSSNSCPQIIQKPFILQ